MSIYRRAGKRALDLVASLTVGMLTAPIHVLCAVALGASAGRPIYFSQERIGRDGRPFKLYKFRTMQVGTHEASGGYPTADMVTPVGRLLRKSSLDELPQLINIIRGDMSLVGPRPTLADQVERYSEEQRGRLAVRPGLTGLAQIRYRNSAPWSVRIESDLEYVVRLSLRCDLAIMAQTLPALLRGGLVQLGQTVDQVDDLGQPERSTT
jgi:lipopolysaccharide/colanic/teichoic acid biosynthesis glycosyltransferase